MRSPKPRRPNGAYLSGIKAALATGPDIQCMIRGQSYMWARMPSFNFLRYSFRRADQTSARRFVGDVAQQGSFLEVV